MSEVTEAFMQTHAERAEARRLWRENISRRIGARVPMQLAVPEVRYLREAGHDEEEDS